MAANLPAWLSMRSSAGGSIAGSRRHPRSAASRTVPASLRPRLSASRSSAFPASPFCGRAATSAITTPSGCSRPSGSWQTSGTASGARSPCATDCRDCPLREAARQSIPSAASRPAADIVKRCNRWCALRLRRLELALARDIPRCTAFFRCPEATVRARRFFLTPTTPRLKSRKTRDDSYLQPTGQLPHRMQKFAVTAILPLLPFAPHASGHPFPWLVAA